MGNTAQAGPPRAVDALRSDSVLAQPFPFDFSRVCGEEWDIVYPSADGLSLEEVKTALEDVGELPDPNPFAMGEADLHSLLSLAGYVLTDGEPLSRESLLKLVLIEFEDDRDFLREWRVAYAEAMADETERFSPMVNYAYPLPGYCGPLADDQAILDLYGGPLCLVTIDGDAYLALTGGGMDLSWDICRAYMLVGYLPPLHFCGDLPEFAGMALTPEWAWVLCGCVRSAELAELWARRARERNSKLLGSMPSAFAMPGTPPGMPLPVLHDWLIDAGRETEAGQVAPFLCREG